MNPIFVVSMLECIDREEERRGEEITDRNGSKERYSVPILNSLIPVKSDHRFLSSVYDKKRALSSSFTSLSFLES